MDGTKRLAILGGGPIGLECLLAAVRDGWDAVLFERGRVAENVRGWGHVRMFSPWGMNVSARGRDALGGDLPPDEALPTGREYATSYLDRLAALPELAGRVEEGFEVLAVSRDGLGKGDLIGDPGRARRPFRVLLRGPGGERAIRAAAVVDATGTFASPRALGPGGAPAVGESAADGLVERRIPDVASEPERYAGLPVAVVGAGHSAATAVLALAGLAGESPSTRVHWITRSATARPVAEVAHDPLAERARVTARANELAADPPSWLRRHAGVHVARLAPDGEGLAVGVARADRTATLEVARVLALVGYRPDPALARELQVRTCWATEGTYPLAAALLARAGAATDCLAAADGLGPETLAHPEPGFLTLGAKSYGRNPNFLVRAGLEQVDHALGLLRAVS